jgi:hypothetical protein
MKLKYIFSERIKYIIIIYVQEIKLKSLESFYM